MNVFIMVTDAVFVVNDIEVGGGAELFKLRFAPMFEKLQTPQIIIQSL